MALKQMGGTGKASNKRPSSKFSSSASSTSKPRRKPSDTHKPKPEQQKTKTKLTTKRRPLHTRYTESQLKVAQLNGIKPIGVQKAPKSKKGKTFVDDKESMNTILALVMAEKEGNIESKMMRARQLEEVREARRVEAEMRVASKREGVEGVKREIKERSKRGKGKERGSGEAAGHASGEVRKEGKKRVSFG